MNEYDFVHPHWLSGRPPKQEKKAVEPPPSKGTLAKYFGSQWFNNSKVILNRLVDFWDPNFDQENLLTQLKSYTDQLLATYLATQSSSLKIPKALVKRIDSFDLLNEQFFIYIGRVTKVLPTESKALIDDVNELIGESRFFISQFNATVDLVWGGRQFAFKPTDRDGKHAFLKAVIAYSAKRRGDKFPPYRTLIESKELKGFIIPARTYGLWKRQMNERTFHYFVQPRRNRQLVLAKMQDT